jgi:hypothetical protein
MVSPDESDDVNNARPDRYGGSGGGGGGAGDARAGYRFESSQHSREF